MRQGAWIRGVGCTHQEIDCCVVAARLVRGLVGRDTIGFAGLSRECEELVRHIQQRDRNANSVWMVRNVVQ